MKRTDFTMSDFTQNIIVAIAIMVVLSPVIKGLIENGL
jgi:hypothetical protein